MVEADGVAKAHGDRVLFDDLAFSLPPGGIVGVVGPNGAGKTTLLRLIVGEEQPDSGVLRLGDSVALAYVDQARAGLEPDDRLEGDLGRPRHDRARPRGSTRGSTSRGSGSRARIAEADQGPCPRVSADRLHLAKLLRSGGNVLLLDEPTNDLDVDTLRAQACWSRSPCAVVVSHDRWFLDRVATHILAFEATRR